MPRVAKATARERSANVLRGIERHLDPANKVMIDGKAFTRAQLVAVFEAHLEALQRVTAARARLSAAIAVERAAAAAAAELTHALRSVVGEAFGYRSGAFAEFGWTPAKKPGPKTTKAKLAVVAKGRATREARKKGGR